MSLSSLLNSSKPRILLATRNQAKARELSSLFSGEDWELTTLAQQGIKVEVSETGKTLEENAVIKATTYAKISNLITLADDSGLEIEALGGEPGPLSARYAGGGASDKERIELILAKLADIPWRRRKARFRCVIAIATPTGETKLCKGECQGIIAFEPKGEQGFGYDPIFYLPQKGKTMAELSLKEKNKISHRGKAAREAKQVLKRLISEISS